MSKKEKLKAPLRYYGSLIEHTKTNKVAFVIFVVLNIAVIGAIIRCIFEKRPSGVFVGVLALILLLIPPFVKKSFKVELPTVLESIAYTFVFCAQILGEIESFYTKVPFWDSMLHTVCGFIFAAFGFCLFDIFNRNKDKNSKFELSPFFLALLAFCFSITIGTVWEFFEFTADILFQGDMQKDYIVKEIGSCIFDPEGLNKSVLIDDITKSIIITEDGSVYEVAGYLDIGLTDTMKDMFVNFLGAFIFSIFGYLYIRSRGKGVVATQFIPVIKEESTHDTSEQNIEEVTEANAPSIEPATENSEQENTEEPQIKAEN